MGDKAHTPPVEAHSTAASWASKACPPPEQTHPQCRLVDMNCQLHLEPPGVAQSVRIASKSSQPQRQLRHCSCATTAALQLSQIPGSAATLLFNSCDTTSNASTAAASNQHSSTGCLCNSCTACRGSTNDLIRTGRQQVPPTAWGAPGSRPCPAF
jgi:hypothetical protein